MAEAYAALRSNRGNRQMEMVGKMEKRKPAIDLHNWIFPNTSITTLLHYRPLAAELLENRGINPWAISQSSIGSVCKSENWPWPVFMEEMEKLPTLGSDVDWKRKPAYYLVDYLFQAHRKFTCVHIPAIHYALSQADSEAGKKVLGRQELLSNWREFAGILEQHMREEEDFIFPKILRNDAALRHDYVDPDFPAGSLSAFVVTHGLHSEKLMNEVVARMKEVLERYLLDGRERPAEFSALLKNFLAELQEHAKLENKALYPMATAMEKKLFDAYIGGKSHMAVANEGGLTGFTHE